MASSADGPAIGVGLGPRNRIREADRQAVLDAAALLQMRRSELAAAAARGEVADVIVAQGFDDVNSWMHEEIRHWRYLHSVRPAANAAQLRVSLPYNRWLLEHGLTMVSVFSADGVDLEARLLLANEPTIEYLLSVAPVQMKIIDRGSVLLEGPVVDGSNTLMRTSAPPIMDAAWRYWQAAMRCAYRADDGLASLADLSARQRQVVALMAHGLGDDAIAEYLGVSVRTVRSDVAALLDALGVRTRFAAGVRLQLWSNVWSDAGG